MVTIGQKEIQPVKVMENRAGGRLSHRLLGRSFRSEWNGTAPAALDRDGSERSPYSALAEYGQRVCR